MIEKINPFSISFGEKPLQFIKRDDVVEPIIACFKSSDPISNTYILSGSRGSGKTVILSEISDLLSHDDNWIIVDLNPYRDMLEQLAAILFEKVKTKQLFLKNEFGFSFTGLSISIEGEKPVSDIISMLDKMLSYLLKKNKKVLITIDDVFKGKKLKKFMFSFQSFARQKYPLFLLMSGLSENVNSIENSQGLTFLLRTPKVYLDPLPLKVIADSYKDLLEIDSSESVKLAKLTNGFAYAYQLLGSLLFNEKERKINNKILQLYDEYLESNVYQKIYEGLCENEKKILFAMCENNRTKIADIISKSGIKNNMLQVYKKNLEKGGIVSSKERGYLTFLLPRFIDYIKFQKALIEE